MSEDVQWQQGADPEVQGATCYFISFEWGDVYIHTEQEQDGQTTYWWQAVDADGYPVAMSRKHPSLDAVKASAEERIRRVSKALQGSSLPPGP